MPITARLVVFVVAGGTIAANLYFLRLLRDVRNVDLVGYIGKGTTFTVMLPAR